MARSTWELAVEKVRPRNAERAKQAKGVMGLLGLCVKLQACQRVVAAPFHTQGACLTGRIREVKRLLHENSANATARRLG